MFKSTCPKCSKKFWKFKQRTEKCKWYQVAKINIHCPSCNAKLRFTKKSKIWESVLKFTLVPFWLIVIFGGWPEIPIIAKLLISTFSVVLLLLFIRYHEFEVENN